MVLVSRFIAALAFFTALAPAAVGAAPPADTPKPGSAAELPTIRVGQPGTYPIYVAPSHVARAKVIGTLHGRTVRAIKSPARISGIGKYMSVDTAGYVWYVETREDKAIRVDPKTLEMTEFYVPKGAAPYSIAVDKKGTVWMTAHGIEMLLEMHPSKGFVIAHEPPSHGFMIHINVANDDTVWITQPGNNQIVSYRTDPGFKEYPIPTRQSGPGRLDFDSAGNVWFPELYVDKLAKLDIATGTIREWNTPTRHGLPAGVRVDRDNHDIVWVNEPMADKLASFSDGKFTEYRIPTVGSVVSTNVTDREGNVWFTEGGWRGSAGGNKVGWLDPRTGVVEEFALPFDNSQPLGMVTGKDGTIWFTLVTGGHICQILPPSAVVSKD